MEKPKGFDTADIDDQKAYLRKMLPKYVDSITERDPVKKQFYKCPLPECKEREHANSTAGAFSIAADKEKWRCFSCNRGGDIFDLIGYLYGYKSGKSGAAVMGKEFKQEFAKACEIFQLKEDFTPPAETAPAADPETARPAEAPTVEPVEDKPAADPAQSIAPGKFKEYLETCRSACTEGSRGYEYLIGRGLTADIIERCKLGYDSVKDIITIPYNNQFTYYVTRSIEGKTYDKPATSAAGYEPLFNGGALLTDRYVFVCESQIDAISIIQAGGTAIAIGGTGSEKLLRALRDKTPSKCLVLSLDNDSAGKRGQKELAEKLEEIGIDFIEANYSLDLYGESCKDANEMLISNSDQLAEDVKRICTEAKNHELETGTGLYSVSAYQDLFKAHQTAQKQRISTGFNVLDRALYGGFCNELYILSAETSIGKSAIVSCLAQNIAASGIDVLYYALEMGRDEFIARGASMISREINKKPIPYGEILNYRWDESAQEFYKRDYKQYEPYVNEYMKRYGEHLYIIEGGFYGKTALQIADTAEEFKKKYNLKQLVIVVDYLQRLKADPDDRAQRDAMSITSAAVQVLGNLASQKHNTVIAISSISNAQKGQRVTDAAGKYSGDISYTGGILLGWNWHGYTDTNKEEEKEETKRICKERGYREMILEVLKQRSGERDNEVTIFYYPAYNYFTAPNTNSGSKARPHRK